MSDQHQGTLAPVDAPGDAELISAVRAGDVAAYGLLFERHVEAARRLGRQLVSSGDVDDLVSEAFAKVLTLLQRGGGPDLAFRAYLLTSVRRLHVDKLRGGARLQTTDDLTPYDPGVPFEDTAVAGFENATAAKAFASLPERWQHVLWHIEVEGQKPADIAPMLGLSPNSVSALAYRAREGLRQAFVTLHATDVVDDRCSQTRAHLGAYLRGGLSRRDSAKVADHLQECRPCSAIYLELSEVNADLGAVLAPLLLGGAGAGYLAAAHAGAVAAAKGGVVLALDRGKEWLLHTPVGWAAGGLAAATVVAVTVAASVGLGGGPDKQTAASPETPRPTSGLSAPAATSPAESPPAPTTGPSRVTPPAVAPEVTPPSQPFVPAGSRPSTPAAPAVAASSQASSASTPPSDGAPFTVTPLAAVSVPDEARSVVIDLTRGVRGEHGVTLRVASASIASRPHHGTVRIGGTAARSSAARLLTEPTERRRPGAVTYTPVLSWRGTEVIAYTLTDGRHTVGGTVEVRTPNRRPVAVADTRTVHLASPGDPVVIGVLDNDTDPNHDRLALAAVSAVTGPLGGRTAIAPDGRSVIYRPGATALAATGSFRYTVSDGHGGTATARVTVTSGNQAPVAVADRVSTPSTGDRSVVIDVLGNDRDPDGDRLTAALSVSVAHGTLVREGNAFRYTPDAAFDGTDTFSYTVSDGYGGTSTAKVTISVDQPRSDVGLTSDHPLDPGAGVIGFHFTATGIPPARHALLTATITGFGGWARPREREDDGPPCSESQSGTTMTVVCTVTGDPNRTEFAFLHADFRPVGAWTVDATLAPVDFAGASGTLHREGGPVPGV